MHDHLLQHHIDDRNNRSSPLAAAPNAAPARRGAERSAVTDLRRQHLVRRVHRLGTRALGELLADLSQAQGIADDVMVRLERYASLDPERVRAVSAERFTPSVFRVAS